MDPTRRSSNNSLNGGQSTASPNSVPPVTNTNTAPAAEQPSVAPLAAGQPVAQPVSPTQPSTPTASTTQANPAQAPTQSASGISSMAPSASANINAFTSRRPTTNTSNSADLMSHNIPSATSPTSGAGGNAGVVSNSSAGGSGGGGANPFATSSSTGSGDIVLNPNNAPKKVPKVPIIIGIVVIVLLVVAGVVLMTLNNNQATQTASATESFNKFFNYLYTGEESTEATEEPNEGMGGWRFVWMLNSAGDGGETSKNYFIRANELWTDVEATWAKPDNEDYQDVQNYFTFSYLLGTDDYVDDAELLNLFQSGQTASQLKTTVAESYQPMTDSSSVAARVYGEASVEYYDTLIKTLTVAEKYSCVEYIDDLTDCPNSTKVQAETQVLTDGLFADPITNDVITISSLDDYLDYPQKVSQELIAAITTLNNSFLEEE